MISQNHGTPVSRRFHVDLEGRIVFFAQRLQLAAVITDEIFDSILINLVNYLRV